MTNGAIAATAAASELVAADEFRGEVILQYMSGDPVFLAFGNDTPVVDSGLVLSADFTTVRIRGDKARLAINGICDTALSAIGTYVTDAVADVGGGGGDAPATTNALLGSLVPTGATALVSAATTGVGTVDVITLTANTIYVDISFDTAAHYATPGASPPTTLYGAPYQPGITYRLQPFKTTNLYVESVGAAGAYHATCYTRA